MRRLAAIACCCAGIAAGLPATASADVACRGDETLVTAVPANYDEVEDAVLCLTNAYRVQNGLPALPHDSRLATAARLHSADMNDRRFFSHNNPDGKTPSERAQAQGYPPNSTGENIAMNGGIGITGIGTAWSLFDQWRNSPGHNTNMLSPAYNAAGMGVDDFCWCNLPLGGYPGIVGTQNFGVAGADSADTKLSLQFGPIPGGSPAPSPPAATGTPASVKRCKKGRKLKRGKCVRKKKKKKKRKR